MSEIDFSKYLLKNESWLGDDTEPRGKHSTNSKLEEKEISLFFTEHLDFVNDEGELDINQESFDKWYKANQQAINSFFEFESIENNDDAKAALYESISEFAISNKDAILNPDNSTETQPLDDNQNDGALTDDDVKGIAKKLNDALILGFSADKEAVSEILGEESGYSNADLVKIIDTYNTEYGEKWGSLVNTIDLGFWDIWDDNTRNTFEKKIANALLSEAQNDNETAYKLLCQEIHNATAGRTGTSDEFIAGVFDGIDDDNINVLTQVIEKYNGYTGSDIFEDISGDISGKNKETYLSKLNKAMQKTGLSNGGTIENDTAELYANRLYEAMKGLGTDDEQVAAILNSGLSDTDLINIMEIYNRDHGSLIKDIDGDFSGISDSEKRKNYEELFAAALVNQVKNGDDTALTLLCKEIHNATVGMTGTADEFIAKIFDRGTTDNSTLKEISDNYSTKNGIAAEPGIYEILMDFSSLEQKRQKYRERLNEINNSN